MAKLVHRSDGRVQVTGRKTKCTPELIKQFQEAIETVYYLSTACNYVKLHVGTATKWVKLGTQHEKEFHPDFGECDDSCDPDSVAKRAFAIALKEGQAKFNYDRLSNIKKHEAKAFIPSMWLLERTQPEKFGLKTRTEHKYSGEVKFKFTTEQRMRALKAAQDSLAIETTQDEDGVYVPVQDE